MGGHKKGQGSKRKPTKATSLPTPQLAQIDKPSVKPVESTNRNLRNKVVGGFVTTFAMALAIYGIRPVLTPSVLPIRGPMTTGRFSITNTGQSPMRDVRVECLGNKVVFDRRHTLVMNGLTTISEYTVPDVESGEAFNADCQQPWHYHSNCCGGLFWFGGNMERDAPSMILDYRLNHGEMTMDHAGPMKGFRDLRGYTGYKVTGIDVSLIIKYRLPLIRIPAVKKIHFIARDNGGGNGLQWRAVPASEPELADGKGGLMVRSNGRHKLSWRAMTLPPAK